MALTVPHHVAEALQVYGIRMEGALAVQLADYLEALLETNRSFNLTAVTEVDEAWTRHIVDSLSLYPDLVELPARATVVDVGSGGGLPAIPLAIALPDLHFTLVETTGKKARFLGDVARVIGLTNVRVINDRAEVVGRGPLRETFHAATSRALSRLPTLLEFTLPLIAVGGLKLAIKGEQAEAEIEEASRALNVLGGVVESLRRTPTGTVIRIRKKAATPARYPRSPGEPKRAPIT